MDSHIAMVLDESGSMGTIKDDTIGGFNEFLADQRTEPGTASMSLVTFDTTVHQGITVQPLEHADELDETTYTPGGRTALHDALVTAVEQTREHLAGMAPGTRPGTIVVVVLTDGKENASETTTEQVRSIVESAQADGWEFLFIGANQDAALTAGRMGIDRDRSLEMAHSGAGARRAQESASAQISQARRTGSMDGFDEEDRQRQREAE